MTQKAELYKKFQLFIMLSFFILILELAGGFFTNSLALLSDSAHILVDLLALLIAYFSMHLSKRNSTEKFTFGYHRAEIFAAIVNGIVLIFVTLYIFYESYERFLVPQEIKAPQMLAISIVGLLANFYVVTKMRDEKQNLNVRAAYLHVLSDTVSSIGVVMAGFLVILTGNHIFDVIISAIIGLLILASSIGLLKESVHVLMEGAPQNINLKRLSNDIMKIKGVQEIHDLHVWSISSDVYALGSHILIDADSIKSMNKTVSRINSMLKSKYNIKYTTIQSECEKCTHADG